MKEQTASLQRKVAISTYATWEWNLPLYDSLLRLIHDGWKHIEIMCEGQGLECLSWEKHRQEEVARLLHREDVSITFHAPITGSNPASMITEERERTLERLSTCFQLATVWPTAYILLHAGEHEDPELGLQYVLAMLEKVLSRFPQGPKLVLENIPPGNHGLGADVEELLFLCRQIGDKERLGLVWDTGHAHLVSPSYVQEGLEQALPYLAGFHLSDNLGQTDDHLAVGKGTVSYDLVKDLQAYLPRPLSFVLECKSYEAIWSSLEYMEKQKWVIK